MALLLLLQGVLLPDFVLDLFEGFKEELLDFAPLVEHHLCQRPHIPQLLVLDPQVLPCVDDVLSLLLDDRLMLIPDQLLLLLEVRDDLGQTLLQDLYLLLVGIDLPCLHLSPLCILLLGALLDGEVSLEVLVDVLLLVDCSLVIVDLVTLRNGLLRPLLILKVDVLLNDLDVYRQEGVTLD